MELNREDMARAHGDELVSQLDRAEPEPSGRLLPNGDLRHEWTGVVTLRGEWGPVILRVHYYVDPDDEAEDMSNYDWASAVDHYSET